MRELGAVVADMAAMPGVQAALVVGRDGFVINAVKTAGILDTDAVAAVVSSGMGASELIGSDLAIGNLRQAMYDFDTAIVFTAPVGKEAIAAVVVGERSNLGSIRYRLRQYAAELREAF